MQRPRILIPLSLQFSVRYILRTGLLRRISDYAQPIVLLAWDDEALTREMEAEGIEVYRLPDSNWTGDYERVRSEINYLHLLRVNTVTTAIDNRRDDLGRTATTRFRRRVRFLVYRMRLGLPGTETRLYRAEHRLLWSDTNIRDFQTIIRKVRPDRVFSITPFLRAEELLLRAASAELFPMSTAILSFDNITTQGRIPVPFQSYFVWNRFNAAELRRAYPEAADAHVTIVGPPQFDFYWDSRYLWEEETWRKRLNIPSACPVVLFGGGYHSIVPHEPQWLELLEHAVESRVLREDTIILFRRHPVDPLGRWLPVLRNSRHIVYDDPWPTGRILGQTNVRRYDIEKLVSTLYHSAVHVNASSTLTIDGAIMDRPQVGPAFDESPDRRYDRISYELYLREHFLPITYSGGLEIVRSSHAMTMAIRSALENPGRLAVERKHLVRELCTFDDGKCTLRLNEALRTFVDGYPPQNATACSDQVMIPSVVAQDRRQ
jgi:hypothetical protein